MGDDLKPDTAGLSCRRALATLPNLLKKLGARNTADLVNKVLGEKSRPNALFPDHRKVSQGSS
jgi:hypothetical protein